MKQPHKHAELIKAWADGADIQYKVGKTWFDVEGDPRWADITEYRIKPEPKPDVVEYGYVMRKSKLGEIIVCQGFHEIPNLKLTFDGETGELKSAEVLK